MESVSAEKAVVQDKEKIKAFESLVAEAAEKFSQINKSETIRIVSHLDADGLSSAAIIVKTLLRENRKYCLSILHQLTEEAAMQLSAESYNHYLFTDLGTGQFSILRKQFAHSGKKIFILDHHHIQDEFEAKKAGTLKVITGLRLFGVQTKPLHRVLNQSSEFLIPGITGSESAAIQFLLQLGINPKGTGTTEWRKLTDLTDEELVKLATAVVLQRLDEEQTEENIRPEYI